MDPSGHAGAPDMVRVQTDVRDVPLETGETLRLGLERDAEGRPAWLHMALGTGIDRDYVETTDAGFAVPAGGLGAIVRALLVHRRSICDADWEAAPGHDTTDPHGTHPVDVLARLTARFAPLLELASLLSEADDRGFRPDNIPPLSPEFARALIEFGDDLRRARYAVEVGHQRERARSE